MGFGAGCGFDGSFILFLILILLVFGMCGCGFIAAEK